jgi:hypothetical protein
VICDIVIAAQSLTAGDQRATDQPMNNNTKPGAVLPPLNFFVGCNDYDRFVCDRAHVEALFNDDETVTDDEPYFDSYAFQIWNQQEHNEYDCALQHLIWEAYNTADFETGHSDDQ